MNNTKRTILALVIIIIVLFLGIRGCMSLTLSSSLKTNKEISQLDTTIYSKNAPQEYLDLFSNQTQQQLICDSTVKCKNRDLITLLHNEQFDIQISKLDISGDLPLNKVVSEAFTTSEQSLNLYYTDYFSNKLFSINYRLGPKEKATKLYFNIEGDNSGVVEKNDHLAYYYSTFKNFSIRYKKEGKIDIFGKARKKNVPVEIMFLKRNSDLYFIVLANINNSANLDKYALYNLIIRNTSIR